MESSWKLAQSRESQLLLSAAHDPSEAIQAVQEKLLAENTTSLPTSSAIVAPTAHHFTSQRASFTRIFAIALLWQRTLSVLNGPSAADRSSRAPSDFSNMALGARIVAPYAGEFDPSHRFVTSWLLPPVVLAVLRALLSLYAFATLFFIFGWNGTHGLSDQSRHSFSYFTHLTYWGLAFYFAYGRRRSALAKG